jgi:hypothetical protein
VLRARLIATAGTVLAVGIIGIAGVALRPMVTDRATDPAGSPTATSTSSVRRAESVAQALPSGFQLAIDLMLERHAALEGVPEVVLKRMHNLTDEAIGTWTAKVEEIDTGADPELANALSSIQQSLDGVAQLRSDIREGPTRVEGELAYVALSNDLLAVASLVPSVGDAEVDAEIEALGAMPLALESFGEQRVVMTKALLRRQASQAAGAESVDHISAADLSSLAQAEATWRRSLADFYISTSDPQRESLDQITDGTSTEGAARVTAHRRSTGSCRSAAWTESRSRRTNTWRPGPS